MTCDGPSVTAAVTVKTNGLSGGTATFTWFTLDANGVRTTFATSKPYPIAAGQTSQTGSAGQSFQNVGGVNWGVSVSSSPLSKNGDQSMNINPYSSRCIPS
jgi:hypothetical protein